IKAMFWWKFRNLKFCQDTRSPTGGVPKFGTHTLTFFERKTKCLRKIDLLPTQKKMAKSFASSPTVHLNIDERSTSYSALYTRTSARSRWERLSLRGIPC